MVNLVLLFALVVTAYCAALGRVQTSRGFAVFSLATAGAWALGAGFLLAAREDARWRYGVVSAATVVEKLSSTGEEGTRTFGPWRSSIVRTSQGFSLHELVARRIVTGSTRAWVVDYRYACGRPASCWGREFVPHATWAALRPGDRVDIRRVPDGFGGVRFEDRTHWSEALIEMLLGASMLLAGKATAALGSLTVPKRAADASAWSKAL